MHQLSEELLAGDLEDMVKHIFEIDSYKSKMGNDSDVVVLTFNAKTYNSATDLVNFIERGYEFVLDAEHSPGELNDGTYTVFVEMPRNRRIHEQIDELLDGMTKLTKLDEFRFRYYKSFRSEPATLDNLDKIIPKTKDDYEVMKNQRNINNFSEFFNRSYVENISMDDDDIVFQKKFQDPLRLQLVDFGRKHEVYGNINGKVMVEQRDIGESLFLARYIGADYNIIKIDNKFIFENAGYALAVKL
jgi:hypothetical protein